MPSERDGHRPTIGIALKDAEKGELFNVELRPVLPGVKDDLEAPKHMANVKFASNINGAG